MIRKRVGTIYVILAFLLAGLLFTLTGFADQEEGEPETTAAETEVSTKSPEDPTEPGTEPATEPERARVTVSYQIDSGEVYPASEEVYEGEHPAGAIAAPVAGRCLTGWTTDQQLTEEDGADKAYEAGEKIELSVIRELNAGRDLSFTMRTAEKTAGEPSVSTPKIAFFGDSITRGRNGAGTPSPVTRPFPWMVGKLLDAETVNFGVGNMGWIGLISQTAYMKISSEDLTAYDDIVICMGVNDTNKAKGTWSSTDEKTVMGQFNKTMQYLLGKDLKARIIIVAPWNTVKVNRKQLADLMKLAADFYGITFVEMTEFPFEPTNTALPDGVHPNQEYYDQIAEWMAGKLKGLGVAKYKSQIAWVEVVEPSVVYNGKEQTRMLKVYGTNRGKIVKSASTGRYAALSGSKYIASYQNNVKAGTATVTVTGKEGSNPFYAGSAVATFTIKPAKITEVIVNRDTMPYTGKAVTQSKLTVVKFGETVLKYGRDYSITYKNNVDVGKVTMTVTGKGSFAGSIKKTFKIIPAAAVLTEVTSTASGRMTVHWEKQREQTTGYEIEYSTKRDFSSESKKLKVTRNTVIAQTIAKLKPGVTYYVHIRTYKTIGSVNYYSAWSKKLPVKIFKK